MYNVRMKRYSTAQARESFAELLDAAEAGRSVVIERRGVRFVLRADRPGRRPPKSRRRVIQVVDPAVTAGQWTWTWRRQGLEFAPRRRRR